MLLENRIKSLGISDRMKLLYSFLQINKIPIIIIIGILVSSALGLLDPIRSYALECSGLINQFKHHVVNVTKEKITNTLSYMQDANLAQQKINELEMEVMRLQFEITNLNMLKAENDELSMLLHLSSNKHYISANFINIVHKKNEDYGIVDVGLDNKISLDDVVIGPCGLVGFVADVSASYSMVRLVSGFGMNIAVKFDVGHALLQTTGDGFGVLRYINGDAPSLGTRLFTVGGNSKYPEGIVVGDVSDTKNELLHVKIASNTNKLKFVSILRSNSKAIQSDEK